MFLFQGDSLSVLSNVPSNSIDAVVTDAPYGLSFMGKKWDYDVPSVELWAEVFRVLKPGGHVLSFGGTRTYHRMVVNIEDAGFEIRDQIQWLYGSGFPKSTDISKRIDKEAGAEREVIGINSSSRPNSKMKGSKGFDGDLNSEESAGNQNITAPSTDQAKQWQGWGSALKPANEPICLARKPLEKGLTLAQNVLKYDTGGLNIDASKVGTETIKISNGKGFGEGGIYGTGVNNKTNNTEHQGRWPANIILDETAAEILDEQSGLLKNGGGNSKCKKGGGFDRSSPITNPTKFAGDSGGASRFFYVAKASKRERNQGLENQVKQKQGARPNSADASGKFPDHDHRETGGNNHPTVKPIKLMEYLCQLITPPNGTILDPFMGSGTTGIAAKNLKFGFVGIELSQEYYEIAKRRIEGIKVGEQVEMFSEASSTI